MCSAGKCRWQPRGGDSREGRPVVGRRRRTTAGTVGSGRRRRQNSGASSRQDLAETVSDRFHRVQRVLLDGLRSAVLAADSQQRLMTRDSDVIARADELRLMMTTCPADSTIGLQMQACTLRGTDTCTTSVSAMARTWACHCGNRSRASVSAPLAVFSSPPSISQRPNCWTPAEQSINQSISIYKVA